MNTGDVGARNWFGRFRASIWGHYGPLLPIQRAYVNSALCFVIYLVIKPFGWDVGQGVFGLALLSWGMALMSDILAIYSRLTKSPIGKLLLVVVVGGGANVAIAMSAQLVNEIVGVDPGKFVHTIAFVSMFMAVVLIQLSLSVIFFFGLGFGVLYLMFHWSAGEGSISMFFPWYKAGERVPYERITVTVRVASFLALGALAYSWAADSQSGYRAFVDDSARWFLYTFEMYEKAPCVLLDGQRVAFLGDGQALVAGGEGGVHLFKMQQCVAGGVGTP